MTSNIMADFFGQILEQKITFFRYFMIPREPVNAQKSTNYQMKIHHLTFRPVCSMILLDAFIYEK